MDEIRNLRHNSQPINDVRTTSATKNKRISLVTLFIVQFLLPNLVLSYGIYTIYFIQKNITFVNALWPPIIFLTTVKISGSWLSIISESFYEHNSRSLYFIGTILCSTGVAMCYFFSENPLSCGFSYGIFGGIGSNLIMSLTNCHLEDIFPYETNLTLGIHHLGIACGLFLMPLIIKFPIEYTSISYVFLIHGSILLHILPLGLLLGKKQISKDQRLTAYSNFGTNETYEEEMKDMSQNEHKLSLITRNWKSPSDSFEQEEDEEVEEIKISPPIPSNKTNTGVNVLPKIIEEDENESDEETNKRNSILLDNNLKRMSVISIKLEEIIQKEEERKIFEVKTKDEVITTVPINTEALNISLSVDENLNSQSRSCCTPYQKYRYRRRIKTCFTSFYKLFLKPIFESFQVIEFYPSLLTNIHSLLSPLIFFNFSLLRASSNMEEINLTELSFMLPMIAFGYLVFLIILPWITIISKRNLKYMYILGCIFSALGIYICVKNRTDDYIIISCLIYGFGFGMESYLKETVIKEFLGVTKWSKCKSSLECVSGVLFLAMILIFKDIFNTEDKFSTLEYNEQWLNLIFCIHLIVCSIWLIFPLINYLFDSLFYKNRSLSY